MCWANINKDHTTEVRVRSFSPSLPLSNLCIVLLTFFWHIRPNYKLSSDVCKKGIFTRRARASAPPCAQSTQCLSVGLGIVQKFSIPIPWVRYRFLNDTFFDTNFMKSVLTRLHLSQKTLFLFFQLVDIYTDSKTHLLSHCTKEQNISNTINQCK